MKKLLLLITTAVLLVAALPVTAQQVSLPFEPVKIDPKLSTEYPEYFREKGIFTGVDYLKFTVTDGAHKQSAAAHLYRSQNSVDWELVRDYTLYRYEPDGATITIQEKPFWL